ncbi:MAG: SUMF1/EgtB/PvdO family nonheme iron enzyme [Myxococcota bacterium]
MLRALVALSALLGLSACVRHAKPAPAAPLASPTPTPSPTPEAKRPPPEMIEILAGLWTRGRDDGPADEKPKKTLDQGAFWIDTMEADVWAYGECVKAGACTVPAKGELCNFGVAGRDQHPINCITWVQAEAYCKFRQKRLPTEAEWEKAARSAKDRPYVWGDAWPPPPGAGNFADTAARLQHPYWTTIAGFDDGAADTAPVDSDTDRTEQGVLNMAGNVAEWVADVYDPRGYVENAPKKGKMHLLRGASFGQDREPELRVTHRSPYDQGHASAHFGVRCARGGPP